MAIRKNASLYQDSEMKKRRWLLTLIFLPSYFQTYSQRYIRFEYRGPRDEPVLGIVLYVNKPKAFSNPMTKYYKIDEKEFNQINLAIKNSSELNESKKSPYFSILFCFKKDNVRDFPIGKKSALVQAFDMVDEALNKNPQKAKISKDYDAVAREAYRLYGKNHP